MAEMQRLFHHNAFGFARQCTCADAIHLHFGNIALLVNHSQLFDFAAFVSETLMQESAVEDSDARCIYLPTRDMALMFALTYKELLLLDELLTQSILLIQIDKLLSN
jgi:hypothetical protein